MVFTLTTVVVGVDDGGGGGVPVPLLALSDRLMLESSDTCESNHIS